HGSTPPARTGVRSSVQVSLTAVPDTGATVDAGGGRGSVSGRGPSVTDGRAKTSVRTGATRVRSRAAKLSPSPRVPAPETDDLAAQLAVEPVFAGDRPRHRRRGADLRCGLARGRRIRGRSQQRPAGAALRQPQARSRQCARRADGRPPGPPR